MNVTWSKEDIVYLEDETGKVEIDPRSSFRNSMDMKISVHSFNTGNFIRVKGNMLSNFKFLVEDIEFLHEGTQIEHNQNSHQILLVSGLDLEQNQIESESFAKLRNFFLFENPIVFNDLKSVVFFGGIFAGLKELNIHQYGNYH